MPPAPLGSGSIRQLSQPALEAGHWAAWQAGWPGVPPSGILLGAVQGQGLANGPHEGLLGALNVTGLSAQHCRE